MKRRREETKYAWIISTIKFEDINVHKTNKRKVNKSKKKNPAAGWEEEKNLRKRTFVMLYDTKIDPIFIDFTKSFQGVWSKYCRNDFQPYWSDIHDLGFHLLKKWSNQWLWIENFLCQIFNSNHIEMVFKWSDWSIDRYSSNHSLFRNQLNVTLDRRTEAVSYCYCTCDDLITTEINNMLFHLTNISFFNIKFSIV